MRLLVFSYDMPHRKTQDVLLALVAAGHTVDTVIAAPPVQLAPRPGTLRTKPRYLMVHHPRDVAAAVGARYLVAPHASEEAVAAVRAMDAEWCVIAGARILPRATIEASGNRIVNVHPGRLPEIRGLDALPRTILADSAPMVTVHLIDRRVDAGRLVAQEELPLRGDESLVEVGFGLDELSVSALLRALPRLDGASPEQFAPLEGGAPSAPLTSDEEQAVIERFPGWLTRHTGVSVGRPS